MLRIAIATAIAALAALAPGVMAGGDRDRHKDDDHHDKGQRTIALPDEFRPEGIASGPKDSFYVGSIPQGSVYRGAYFTDSLVQQLYRVRISRHGGVSQPEIIPITGDLVYEAGFNANGIEATRDGHRLIVVQSNTGELFSIKPHSGRSEQIELDGSLTNGDGLLLDDDELYVVRNRLNTIAVVDLDRDLDEGEIEDELTDPLLDVPTTIAPFGKFIYAVNARFGRPDESDDDIIRLRP